MEDKNDIELAIVGQRLKYLEEWREALSRELSKLEDKILKELQGRPSWAVSIIFTLLASACTGLLVLNITRKG